MTGESKPNVQELHAIWDAANQRVRAHERLLASALKLFQEGKVPLPQEIIAEVQAMRSDCNAKFKALLAAIGQVKPR
jgi:hypothetical protein